MSGLERDAKHRYRWEGGPWVPGVTTIQGMKAKGFGLEHWMKRTVAIAAATHVGMLSTMVESGGAEAAADWLVKLPDRERDTSADIGTRVHALCEQIALGNGDDLIVTEQERPYIEGYRRDFLDRHLPEFRAVEFMVYSHQYQYGGTADFAAVIKGETWLCDIKTSKSAHEETAIQLAALRWADWLGLPGDPKKYAIPQATRFGVVHVRPEGSKLIPYNVGGEDFAAFLACRRLYSWVNERAPHTKEQAA